MLILTCLLAFYLAWNLGANDVANSMGTSVGSKAVTLRQALVIAGVLEFTGAVLFGQNVSETLVTKVVSPEFFVQTPQVFLAGMLAVLIASGLWMNIATAFGLPVSSSHATVGAIAGFGWAAVGFNAVDWPSIRIITLTWILTPVLSGAIAALFYITIQRFILTQPHSLQQLQEWIPWLSTALFSIFGVIVLPNFSASMQRFLSQQLGVLLPTHTILLGTSAIAISGLTLILWNQLERAIGERGLAIGERGLAIGERGLAIGERGLAIGERGLAIGERGLAIGEWGLAIGERGLGIRKGSETFEIQVTNSSIQNPKSKIQNSEVDSSIQNPKSVRLSFRPERSSRRAHDEAKIQNLSPSPPLSLSPASPSLTELIFARFQLLSACFVAFAHGSNDVGNAVAPLAAIAATWQTGAVPLRSIHIPLWILMLGGVGIVAGLAVWGKRVITTVGENIIALQPSGGFCAELATATTVLLASQAGLPVSTSHALVGGVVGVGLSQGWKTVKLQTLKNIGLTWMITVPAAIGLGAIAFRLLRLLFS